MPRRRLEKLCMHSSRWSMIQGHSPTCSPSYTAATDSGEPAVSQGAALQVDGAKPWIWCCPVWKRSSDLLKKLRSYQDEKFCFFSCCSIAQQQVEHGRDDRSLPKDRAGKIWKRSTDRSPILGLVLKRKTVLMQTHLSLPCKFLTYWLISVKCQSWIFQRY